MGKKKGCSFWFGGGGLWERAQRVEMGGKVHGDCWAREKGGGN